MTGHCEKVKQLLDSFYDNELHGSEYDAVNAHLRECESCSNDLKKLERTGSMLRAHYESLASSEDLSSVWRRVEAATEAFAPQEPTPLRDKLIRIFTIPRPAWVAAGLFAIIVIIAFSYFPVGQRSTLAANDCIIDSVDAEGCSVMLYEVGDTKMKMIWVMEPENGKTFTNRGVTS
jgi:hypothetical protein